MPGRGAGSPTKEAQLESSAVKCAEKVLEHSPYLKGTKGSAEQKEMD